MVTSLIHLKPEIIDYILENPSKHSVDAIKESFRLFPGAPLVIRSMKCPISFDKYKFETGTRIASCPFSFHNDPTYWKDPTVYDPRRFKDLDERKTYTENYMPFGIAREDGGRGCVAAHYALMLTSTVVETFVLKYRLSMNDNYKHTVYPYVGAIRPKKNIMVNIYPIFNLNKTLTYTNPHLPKAGCCSKNRYIDDFHKIMIALTKRNISSSNLFTVEDIHNQELVKNKKIKLLPYITKEILLTKNRHGNNVLHYAIINNSDFLIFL